MIVVIMIIISSTGTCFEVRGGGPKHLLGSRIHSSTNATACLGSQMPRYQKRETHFQKMEGPSLHAVHVKLDALCPYFAAIGNMYYHRLALKGKLQLQQALDGDSCLST